MPELDDHEPDDTDVFQAEVDSEPTAVPDDGVTEPLDDDDFDDEED